MRIDQKKESVELSEIYCQLKLLLQWLNTKLKYIAWHQSTTYAAFRHDSQYTNVLTLLTFELIRSIKISFEQARDHIVQMLLHLML